MLYSALAYLLTGLAGFIVGGLLNMLTKMLLFMLVSAIVGREKIVTMFGKIMRPIDFISNILQGYVSVALGIWIFGLFAVRVDFFLCFFLLIGFLWFDFVQLRRQRQMFESGELPPQFAMFGEGMQEQLRAMLYNQAIIGMIGKATGVVLAGINLIGFIFSNQ